MKISSTLLIPFLLSVAPAISLPRDATDGVYVHFSDHHGNITTYHESSGLFPRNLSPLQSTPLIGRQDEGGKPEVNKESSGQTLDINDVFSGAISFEEWFGCNGRDIAGGQQVNGKATRAVSASYKKGSVELYACDYGNGQHWTGAQMHQAIERITGQMRSGDTMYAGYVSYTAWKASYGFTNAGGNYC